ncbi:Aste57867_16769 [Aphanomyces stellatus]|uniref:Aste57867_16769 protein n=1 Tax=Aphanomyces stellatus TaxID=120398 RepID=A0A485L7D1_9STRA|nr:hypothetical protein As57867_016712 [Aphanomyces stellatus]VFT93534.1 Aste57867_16769 [Aphanomyces stellatus]
MEGRRILEETEVYETPEVEVYPHASNNTTHPYAHIDDMPTSDMNEIDRAPLRPADAFHAFLGASVPQGELKVVPRGELETPTMRYQRLQQEMGELEHDLELLQNISKEASDPPTYRTMLAGLKSLQANLSQLQLDPSVSSTPQVQAQQQLSSQLWKDIETFRRASSAKTPADSSTGLIYEVFAVQEEDKVATLKLAAVEQRVAQLERVVGSASAAPSPASMLQSVQELETRMSLLNPSQVETLSARVAALLHDLTSIAKLQETNPVAQQALATAQESAQLNVMFDQLQTVGTTAAAFPHLVDQIASFKAIHDDAATFSQRLTALERNTDQLSAILSTDADLLRNMEDNLTANLSVFQSNMESLDQRMQALLLHST